MTDSSVNYVRRHLRFGWWSLLLFLTLGAVLELMHGLKVGYFLDVSNETRRMLWRLAHAHGSLIGVLQLVFAGTIRLQGQGAPWIRNASRCLLLAGILLPAGFFLGGVIVYGADPWIGILLVPVGAIFLFLGVLSTARGVGRPPTS